MLILYTRDPTLKTTYRLCASIKCSMWFLNAQQVCEIQLQCHQYGKECTMYFFLNTNPCSGVSIPLYQGYFFSPHWLEKQRMLRCVWIKPLPLGRETKLETPHFIPGYGSLSHTKPVPDLSSSSHRLERRGGGKLCVSVWERGFRDH